MATSDDDTLAKLRALSFEKLAELSKQAAAEQGVNLQPVLDLWRHAIAVGAMTESEAVNKFVDLFAQSMLS